MRLAPVLVPAVLALAALAGEGRAAAQGAPAIAGVPAPAPAQSWATVQAVDRTRAGRLHVACGELDSAVRAYMEAVSFDATYGPAYLELGHAYEARGEPADADRAYSMGIDHIAGFADGFRARGALRMRVHRAAEAIVDLEEAAALEPDAIAALKALGDAYKSVRALPAALAVARRLEAVAEAQGDVRTAADARLEARALVVLVGELDPVAAGKSGRGAVRRALWAASRRR